MNRLFTGTAIALALALPAAAQTIVKRTDTDIAFARPAVTVDGWLPLDAQPDALAELDEMEDADLYSSLSDEKIGEVDDIVIDASGQIRYVELDVGGFLGLGEKHVLVPFDELQILAEADGDDFRVYVAATQEQLEQYPSYDD